MIVGGGAAGIAAAHCLHQAGVPCKLLEARDRLGGRAWTIKSAEAGFPIDLGCGWLHSADRNPWTDIAMANGFTLDKTPPPWMRPSSPVGFPLEQQREFRRAFDDYYDRLADIAEKPQDAPAAAALDPSNPWSRLIGAAGTYITGAELDKVSAIDLHRYADTDINWRVIEGYGTLISSFASALDVVLSCEVTRIDHSGKRIRVETTSGTVDCDQVIVTIPTSLLANSAIDFLPALPAKTEAASKLPLGLNNKLFLSLDHAEEFEMDSRLFGRIDTTATATYHFRPFGRPQIEGYFGGSLAHELEKGGPGAFFAFAKQELTRLLGQDFASRIQLLTLQTWGTDKFSRGAYSYAVPGHADSRATLATPVDDRIFFAGEACSYDQFSTAHGAYLTGLAAANRIISSQRRA